MERMSILDNYYGEGKSIRDKITELEEENKKLKEELKKDDREVQVDVDKELLKANDYLIKENKKIKERIKELEQCNLNLQTWLDNKEKLNKGYRKQIDKYKRQYEHSMGEDDELIYEEGLYD